jgi:hypothetical protein
MAGATDDRSSDLPWSFVFDPVANAHALVDVQRRGLEAARQVVDQLLVGMEAANGSTQPSEDGPKGPPDLAELWAAFVYQTMSTLGRSDENGRVPAQEVGAVARVGGADVGRIELATDGAGHVEAGSFWLQNSSTEDTGALRVHVGDLRSSAGAVVTGLVIEPSIIASLAAGSARRIALRGTLSGSLASGVYRGVIQVAGAPDVAVAVDVKVES